ncbi:MAG: Ig-like domain repeat protein [Treponema sp.]|nr:Ig-like domain repeat protein [Treponema sp.]
MKRVIRHLLLCIPLVAALFTNCELGLGEAVDTTAPTVSIKYPPASSTIRGSFILAGECDDDKHVTSVKVTLQDTGTGISYGAFDANVDKKKWNIELNGPGTYNGWQFPDGKYSVEVVAIDGAGRKSGIFSRAYDIDNTPPLFVLSKPGSAKINAPSKYGTSLKVSGTIAEDHSVRKVNLKVYDANECTQSGGFVTGISDGVIPLNGTDGWTETNVNTAGGTEILFARKNKDPLAGDPLDIRYQQVYGNSTGDKSFVCKFELSDSANEYRNPSETSNDSEGNTTSKFFLYDEVYTDWLSEASNLDIGTVKNIINGTVDSSVVSSGKIEQIKDQYEENARENAVFSLNPDANPKYQVFGFDCNDITQVNSKASGEQLITVNVTAGLNGTLITPNSIAVYQFGPYTNVLNQAEIEKIYSSSDEIFNSYYESQRAGNKACLLGFNGNREETNPNKQKQVKYSLEGYADPERHDNCTDDSSDSSYNYQVKVANSIEEDKYYYICCKAMDVDDEYAEPVKAAYAFKGFSTNSPPEIYWMDKGETGYPNAANDQGIVENTINTVTNEFITTGSLKFSGKVVNRDGLPKIVKISYSGSRIDETGVEAPVSYSDVDITSSFSTSTGYWEFALPEIVEQGKRYLYDITVNVKNSSDLTDSRSRKFYVDTEKPVVTISSVTPHVDSIVGTETHRYLNGTFSVTGSIDETSLEEVWYEIWSNGDSTPAYSKSLGAKYTVSSNDIKIDTTDEITFNLGDDADTKPVNVILYAKDKAGNIGSVSTTQFNNALTYNIDQSTDKPVIKPSNFCNVTLVENLSSESDFDNNKGNIFDKVTNHKLIGMVEDDDGIDSIEVWYYNSDGTAVLNRDTVGGFTRGTTTASFTYNGLPKNPGIYRIGIVATDVTYISGTPEGMSAEAVEAINANRQTAYGPFLVAIDNENPKLSETEVGTEDRQYVREDVDSTPENEASITFSGKISDDWKLSSLEVAVTAADTLDEEQVLYATVKIELDENGVWNQFEKNDEGEWVSSVGHSFVIDDEGVWTHVPDLRTFNQGYMTFVFTVTDSAGKTGAVTRYVCKDMTPPEFGTSLIRDPQNENYIAENVAPYITTAQSAIGWFNTSTLHVSGGIKDDASGIRKVEYTLDTGENPSWTEFSGTSTFGGTVANVSDGSVIILRATDNAGNVSSINISGIHVDIGVPSIEIKKIDGETDGIGNVLSNGVADINIEGIAEDSLSGISEILISIGDKDFTSAGKPDVTVSESDITVSEENAKKFNWRTVIPAEKITRTGTVWARVKDGAGNMAELNLFSLQYDDTAPDIDFTESIKDAVVNKLISISGVANDDQKLESIKLEYQSSATEWKELTANGTESGTKVSGTYNWRLDNLDTQTAFGETVYDCNSSKEGVQVKLKATATDSAGNENTAEAEITIDQNTDRPLITFTNISDLEDMDENTYPFFNNLTLMGTLTDDDGIDSRVQLKIIANLWDTSSAVPSAPEAPTESDWAAVPPLNLSNGSWIFKSSNQGKQDIYFYVKDSKGGEFISKTNGYEPSDSYNAVYIKDDHTKFGDGAGSSTVLRIRVDTQDPEAKDLEFNLYSKKAAEYSSDWIDSTNGRLFGGDVSKFKVRIYAADANGINSVTATMGESEGTQGYAQYEFNYVGTDPVNKNGIWECEDILTGGETLTGNLKDGINYFTVEVRDKADRPRSSTVQLTVDNTKPVISINLPRPDNNATVSGEVNVYGSLSEVCDVYYAISTSGDVSPDDDTTPLTSWKKHEDGSIVTIADIKDKVDYCDEPIKGTTTEWYLYFDGDIDASQALTHTKLLNDYLVDYGITTREALSSTLEDRFDTVVDLWLWVKAVDTAGNVTEKRQAAYLDPQGDRPTVSINYPETDGDVLGGNIKLYGEAMDNKFVDSVWVQLISQKEHLDAYCNPVNWNENNADDVVRYVETSSTDEAGHTVYSYTSVFTKFAPTKDDLDALAEYGYSVYKMSSYDPDTSTPWIKGTSVLGAGETAADYAILANFTGSTWNIKLNESGEFNPIVDEENDISQKENIVAVRLISKDGDKKTSIYADRLFKIDNDKPVFGSTQPLYVVKSASVDYDAEATASREYNDDMFVKDTWYLIGSVEDDVGIKTLNIKDNKRNRTTKLVIDKVGQSGGTDFDVKVDGKVVYFKYKLKTDTGVGELDYTFEAEDIAEGSSHGQTKDIKINYDNTSPVLAGLIDAGYDISPSVKQTGKFYTFGSTVKENAVGNVNQSGFDYVAFYFMRRSDRSKDSKNYLYDVMLERTKTEGGTTINDYNKINLSAGSIVFEDGIYWNQKTVTRDADNLNLIKMPAPDKNVHPGGLVKIGGTIYLVDSVSGINVTLNGNIPVNYTDALFGYAMVVNNTVT